MGDWNKEPWGNDEAADWFSKYWNGGGIELVINEIKNFSPEEEKYDSIRAACLVLECFGSAYAWPFKYFDEREPTINRAIEILQKMITISDEKWGFLDMWESDKEIIMNVKKQISILQSYIK